MNQINVSIDAATKQTYERIRVGSKFERVIDNIRAVNRAKEELRSDTPRVCFNVTLMRSNIEELPDIIRLAHELGVEGVGTVHMMPFAIAVVDPLAESLRSHKSLCNRKLDEARAMAEEYQVWVSLPEKFDEEAAPAPLSQIGKKHRDLTFLGDRQEITTQPSCHFPWHFVGIDWDGGVHPCGWWFNEELMGNIKTERFEEIWNNERYQRLRSEHMTRKWRAVCRTCPTAGIGDVNNPNSFQVK